MLCRNLQFLPPCQPDRLHLDRLRSVGCIPEFQGPRGKAWTPVTSLRGTCDGHTHGSGPIYHGRWGPFIISDDSFLRLWLIFGCPFLFSFTAGFIILWTLSDGGWSPFYLVTYGTDWMDVCWGIMIPKKGYLVSQINLRSRQFIWAADLVYSFKEYLVDILLKSI